MSWYDYGNGIGAMLPDDVYAGGGAPPTAPQPWSYGLPAEVLHSIQGVAPANEETIDATDPSVITPGLGGPALDAALNYQQSQQGAAPPTAPDAPQIGSSTGLGGPALDAALAAAQQRTMGQAPQPQADAVSSAAVLAAAPGGQAPQPSAPPRAGIVDPFPANPARPTDPNEPPPLSQQPFNPAAGYNDMDAAQRRAAHVAEDQADAVNTIKQDALAKQAELQAQRAAAIEREQAEQQKNYAELSAAVDARTKATVDPNRRWNDLSTGRKIVAGIGVVLAGLGQAIAGQGTHPNLGLQLIHDAIRDDVEGQVRNQQNLGENVALLKGKAAAYDDVAKTEQGQFAMRMADGLEHAAQQIDAAGAQYANPMLKTKALEAAAQLRMQRDQNIAAAAAQNAAMQAAEREKAEKAAMERAKLAEEKRAHDLSAWTTTRGQDLADARARDEIKQKELDRQEARADRLDKKAEVASDGTIGGVPVGVDANGDVQYGVVRNGDGTPLVIRDKEAKAKLSTMLAAGDNVNRLSNQLAREIKDWGGQSDLVKSKHWQQLKGDYEDLIFALHSAKGIEGFRPGTAEMLEKLTGDVDPTSFIRNASHGILRARDNVNSDIDAQLRRQANYTGKKFAPADTSQPTEPIPDDFDTWGADLNKDPRHTDAQDLSPSDRIYLGVGGSSPDEQTRFLNARAFAHTDSNDLPPEQRAQFENFTDEHPDVVAAWRTGVAPSKLWAIEKLRDALSSKKPELAGRAKAILKDAVEKAPDSWTRSQASKLLIDASQSDIPLNPSGLDDPLNR